MPENASDSRSKERFSNRVGDYRRFRPSYPLALGFIGAVR
ncbi:hypothetical protein BH09SUM1_BH09SUM1_24790 [soil metagenome]